MNSKKKAQTALNSLTKVIKSLRGIHGGWRGIKNAALKIVPEVEKLGKTLKLSGAEKKEVAVEAVVMVIQTYGGGWIKWVPEFVLRWAIGSAIEQAVRLMKNGGKS